MQLVLHDEVWWGDLAVGAEEPSCLFTPCHHRELVDGADEQRRPHLVHVGINDENRQPLSELAGRARAADDELFGAPVDVVGRHRQSGTAPWALEELLRVARISRRLLVLERP